MYTALPALPQSNQASRALTLPRAILDHSAKDEKSGASSPYVRTRANSWPHRDNGITFRNPLVEQRLQLSPANHQGKGSAGGQAAAPKSDFVASSPRTTACCPRIVDLVGIASRGSSMGAFRRPKDPLSCAISLSALASAASSSSLF